MEELFVIQSGTKPTDMYQIGIGSAIGDVEYYGCQRKRRSFLSSW